MYVLVSMTLKECDADRTEIASVINVTLVHIMTDLPSMHHYYILYETQPRRNVY